MLTLMEMVRSAERQRWRDWEERQARAIERSRNRFEPIDLPAAPPTATEDPPAAGTRNEQPAG